MFKIAKKTRRVGLETSKVLFQIHVRRLTIPDSVVTESNALLSVCFERGGKMASSSDKMADVRVNSKYVLEINETLSVVATLYKESTGLYQTKKGKLIVRQRKVSKFGSDVFKGLGMVHLNLHDLCGNLSARNYNYELEKCQPGATLEVSIVAKFLGESNTGDETMSIISGMSEESAGASFFEDDRGPATDVESSLHSIPLQNFSLRLSVSKDSPIAAVPEWYKAIEEGDETEEAGSPVGPLPLPVETETKSDLAIGEPELRLRCAALERKVKTQESLISELKSSFAKREDDQLTFVTAHSKELESAVAQSASEVQSLRSELLASRSAYDSMCQKYSLLASELARLHSSGTDGQDSPTLSPPRAESPVSSDQPALLALIAAQSDSDSQQTARLLTLTSQLKEAQAKLSAMELAHKAAMAEEMSQSTALLQELISSKMKFATMATEFDHEMMKRFAMRRKLQQYAERVASLEVVIATSEWMSRNLSTKLDEHIPG